MDYSKTIIYKIVCNDLDIKEVYVGSTVNFTRRKCHHKSCCNDVNNKGYNYKKYQFIRANGGWDNWTMYEIEKFPCNDKHEGCARERYWIENLNATLNKQIPTRTYKEWCEDNKEIIQQKNKEYCKDNRDKIKEHKKQYCEDNKERFLEIAKQYYKTNKEIILEKVKEYRDNNKEVILEKKKMYNEINKQVISERRKTNFNCDCGSIYRIYDKKQHLRTKKHLKYIESTK
jgi:hypothetical protein